MHPLSHSCILYFSQIFVWDRFHQWKEVGVDSFNPQFCLPIYFLIWVSRVSMCQTKKPSWRSHFPLQTLENFSELWESIESKQTLVKGHRNGKKKAWGSLLKLIVAVAMYNQHKIMVVISSQAISKLLLVMYISLG